MNNKIYTYHVAKLWNLQMPRYYIHHVFLLLWSGVLSQELQFLSTFLLKMYTLPLMFHLRDGSSVYSTWLVRLDSLLIKSQVKLVTQTFSDSTHPYSTCTIPWWWSVAGLVAELKLIFCCSGLTLSRLNWVPPAVPFFFSIDQSKQKGNHKQVLIIPVLYYTKLLHFTTYLLNY